RHHAGAAVPAGNALPAPRADPGHSTARPAKPAWRQRGDRLDAWAGHLDERKNVGDTASLCGSREAAMKRAPKNNHQNKKEYKPLKTFLDYLSNRPYLSASVRPPRACPIPHTRFARV